MHISCVKVTQGTGSSDYGTEMFDIESGDEIDSYKDTADSFIPFKRTRQLISGSYDKPIRIWDLNAGAGHDIPGSEENILEAAFIF
jgi:WD40 repeat protein